MRPRLAALALALMVLAGCAAPAPIPPEAEAPPSTTEAETRAAPPPLNPCNFYDSPLVSRHLKEAEALDLPGLRCLVVPHYAPEMDLLASALAGQPAEGFDTVVVLGPDHTGRGGGISVSGRGWRTPLGVLAGSEAAAGRLLDDSAIKAQENHDLLAEDHAVSTLMPYLAAALPEARVAGVLISRYTALARLEALADALARLGEDSRLLVVLSVDFSHYQSPGFAEKCDAETVDLVKQGGLVPILELQSTHVDSPEALALLLLLGQRLGLEPQLEEKRMSTFVENGAVMAGSFMLWSLRE